jgi:hypothetical protein
MNTREIKAWLKKTFDLKKVRITSTQTKNPYFTAWIPSDDRFSNVATYSEQFPLEFRELALKVIYGDTWKSLPGREGNAGNVNGHSIAMKETEWNNLIATWDTILAAKSIPQEFFNNPVDGDRGTDKV